MLSKQALIILAEGVEEMEAVTPLDILRRAEIEVTLAALGDSLVVTGRSGITLQADVLLKDLEDPAGFDALILPGGPGTKHLRASSMVIELVRDYAAQGKVIAAICAAPTVLQDAGILQGKRYTAHFTTQGELPNIDKKLSVVSDGNIITSKGAGTALAFSLVLVERLIGQKIALKIQKSIEML